MVLYALHRLNFRLKVEIVTNIIHFKTICAFLLFYLKYIVLYELLNNPTPNFKYPIWYLLLKKNI